MWLKYLNQFSIVGALAWEWAVLEFKTCSCLENKTLFLKIVYRRWVTQHFHIWRLIHWKSFLKQVFGTSYLPSVRVAQVLEINLALLPMPRENLLKRHFCLWLTMVTTHCIRMQPPPFDQALTQCIMNLKQCLLLTISFFIIWWVGHQCPLPDKSTGIFLSVNHLLTLLSLTSMRYQWSRLNTGIYGETKFFHKNVGGLIRSALCKGTHTDPMTLRRKDDRKLGGTWGGQSRF